MRGVGRVHLRRANRDFAAFRQVFAGREYDLSAIGGARARVDARYHAILDAGRTPIIIDAGANVGAASLWFARAFPKAAIVAVEPDPENARLLRLNTAGTAQIIIREAAIAGEHGRVSLDNSGNTNMGWAVTTVRTETGGLAAITMDDAVASVPNGAPFIAKIDIEGFEADLFSGDLAWIDRMAVVMIEPHDWLFPGKKTSRSFQSAMRDRDFELFISGENLVYVAD
jgi:FkbM family methyltransferase